MAEGLPDQYQRDIDRAQTKAVLAQLLMRQQLQPRGQMVSGHYVKSAPSQFLAQLANSLVSSKMLTDSSEMASDARSRYSADAQKDLARVIGMTMPQQEYIAGPPEPGADTYPSRQIPPDLMAAERAAEGSQFPQTKALAKALAEQRMKLFAEMAKTSSGPSVQAAGMAGGDPSQLKPNQWGQTVIKDVPGVGVLAETQDERGNIRQTGISRPTQVRVDNAPAHADIQSINKRDERLAESRPQLMQAAQIMQPLAEAFQAVSSGQLNTGAQASTVTQIQALGKLIGVPVPPGVPLTQYYQNTLLPAITSSLRAVAPKGSTSDRELALARQYAIDIDKDPRAIVASIASLMRASVAAIQDHNNQVERYRGFRAQAGMNPAMADDLTVPWSFTGVSEEEGMKMLKAPITDFFKEAPPPPPQQKRRILDPIPYTPQ